MLLISNLEIIFKTSQNLIRKKGKNVWKATHKKTGIQFLSLLRLESNDHTEALFHQFQSFQTVKGKFINILRAHFFVQNFATKITKLCFGFEIFWHQNIGKKARTKC